MPTSREPTSTKPGDQHAEAPRSTRNAKGLLIVGSVIGVLAAAFTWHALATAPPGHFGAGFVILTTGPMFIISAILLVGGVLGGWRTWFDEPVDLPTILKESNATESHTGHPTPESN